MDTSIITTILIVIYLPGIFVALALERLQSRAIHGSAERFALTTWCIIFRTVLLLFATIIAVNSVMSKDYVLASFWTINIGLNVAVLYLLLRQDNWFNKQWKKLKKAVKNFQESLQSSFMPAPAPG